MVRHMSTDVFNHVARSHGVGIFAKSEGPGVYPENYRLKDTPECKGNEPLTKLIHLIPLCTERHIKLL